MAIKPTDYGQYFQPNQQITATFRMKNNSFLENNAVVTFFKENLLFIELIGNGLPAEPGINENADILITFWSGWSLNRCNATLSSTIDQRQVCVKLTGQITEQQRRDYFRLDVELPVSWSIPEEQQQEEVEMAWEAEREMLAAAMPPLMQEYQDSFKVVKGNNLEEILPQKVNLSGGGVRLKMPVQTEAGTFVSLKLFLPLLPPRIIPVVAEVLRNSEITFKWEKGSQYIAAMRFHCITGKDRETIISFLFSEQRRILLLSQDRIIS